MARLDRQISINDAVAILENAIEMVLDLQGSTGIEVDDRCLIPQEVTEAASVAVQHFFIFDYDE